MESGDFCNVGLALGLGSYGETDRRSSSDQHQAKTILSLKYDHVLPSLSLGPAEGARQPSGSKEDAGDDKGERRSRDDHQLCRQMSSISQGSSQSNCSTVKKEKDDFGAEEGDAEKLSSRMISDEDEEGSPRKKLRLTKEQSAILEDSFKDHSTLNPNQKQALAKQLNLRPRQVEVWFQNRRARTKLKQTEMDCELLKKCCETLTEENRRLKKELQELKALKLTLPQPQPQQPIYMQMPAATLTMCPSCERIINNASSAAGGSNGGAAAFTIYHKPAAAQLCNHFSHPSAACGSLTS
ncbi:hypothetical protein Nepgr_005053 [Nepenthes gracilis]|uniref:Homeobox domain-containing protein n=1 Tax=Nepenthes gracilis TaxID=150966 RepID=A0AAD3S2G9_NEPGR|nr:hypothetical protein Nepgr_005053 [Nepenthes gracilis]